MEIVEKMLAGNTYALAKTITKIENQPEKSSAIIRAIFPHTGHAHIVGVTGPPGAGKSTLVDKLVKHLLKDGSRVAVVAVDPSSPFTGGSILGDRVRMNDLNLEENVFIRSMGARGSQGGISIATYFVAAVLDACGYDYVFIETVGVGQSEVDVLKVADTTFLVLAPGLGDDIQAFKAGIMEAGDAFVINKADRDGAQRLKREIESVMTMSPEENVRPVLMTEAENNLGIDALIDFLGFRERYLLSEKHRPVHFREKLKDQLISVMERRLSSMVEEKIKKYDNIDTVLDKILNGQLDFYSVVDKNIENILDDSVKSMEG